MAEKVIFDPENLLIIVKDGYTELDAKEDIYSDWKEWFQQDDNSKWPQAFRTVGGDPTVPGSYIGAYYFLLNGWRIRPSEADHQLVVDGNIFVEGGGNPFVPTVGPYTVLVTLTVSSVSTNLVAEIPEIQYSSFNHGVSVDITSEYSGTTFPVGTGSAPVNNLADALVILDSRGFSTFYIHGDITIDNSLNFDDLIFVGESQTKSEFDVDPDASVVGCEFYDAHVKGTLDGNCKLKNCCVDNLLYINGIVEQCTLNEGTITLGGSAAACFVDCWSGPGSNTPIIDMGGSGQALSLRNYNGVVEIKNKTGNDVCSIDLNSGHIILDNTVTNGPVIIRGVGKITDNSNGATVNLEDLVNPSNVATGVWNDTLSQYTSAGTAGQIINQIKKLAALLPATV